MNNNFKFKQTEINSDKMIKKTSNILEKKQSEVNPIYVYSKKIKGNVIDTDKKTREIDNTKISKVVDSLLNVGKQKYFDELELNQNCKDWISSLLEKYPNIDERDIKELLNDFTDSMNTSMRKDENYAVAIIKKKSLILCHSIFGEETITPKWQVMERMLDKDNVIRFVYFEQDKYEKIKIIFYEDTKSMFFTQWLGLSEKESFSYMGGKNRIYTELKDSTLVFEFTDEDFEKKIINDKIFHIEGNQIILPNPIEILPITQIRVGKKPYNNANDFIQDFLAKRYDLNFYRKECKKLRNSIIPLSIKLIDDEYAVYNKHETLIKKRNQNFYILFCDGTIEIRESFFDKIKAKFLNNEKIKLFHAGIDFNLSQCKIKNLEIYNNIKCDNVKFIIDYYNDLKINGDFDIILIYLIFYILKEENKKLPISYFFEKMANSLINKINFSCKFANMEDDIIELKSRDFSSGNNKDIVKKLSEDISKKIITSNFKIYILGADEKNKEFEPLVSNKFSDSRIHDIIELLRKNIKNSNVDYLNFLKIPFKDNKNCILVLIIKKGK